MAYIQRDGREGGKPELFSFPLPALAGLFMKISPSVSNGGKRNRWAHFCALAGGEQKDVPMVVRPVPDRSPARADRQSLDALVQSRLTGSLSMRA